MQGIYSYIPETNYVPREYSVAAILLLLFTVLISLVSTLNLLHFYISTFRSMCAVPNMTIFCSSLTSWFPGMLLMYFLNDFEIIPVLEIEYFFIDCERYSSLRKTYLSLVINQEVYSQNYFSEELCWQQYHLV